MAVSVQTLLLSKPSMWHLGEPPNSFSSEAGGQPVSMSYPYPPGLDNTSPMIPDYHHSMDPEQLDSPSQMTPLSPGKNRGFASNSKAAKIKRSMSTPNVRGQSSADAAAMALQAEKRRNKLGYHRTSVACGHCRRRKIRCIPAPADPTNRCSNCIRLKKECTFFPVDQQPMPEPKRKGSKAHSGTAGTSESSSPSTASGQLPDLPTAVSFPHNFNMPPIQDLGGPQMKRQRTDSFSPETKVVTTSRNFEYNHGATNWMTSNVSPTSKPPSEVPHNFWRANPHDSPITPAFSPFTPTSQSIPHPQLWSNQHGEPSPRDDLSWNIPPQRSMSYNNLDSLQNQQQYAPYAQPPQSGSENYSAKPRVLHSMYSPPMVTDVPSSIQGVIQHPQSAGALPSFPPWQTSFPYQKPASSAAESYSNWNGSQGAPLPTPVETAGHPYPYGEQSNGMYYPTAQR